jgi:hypothetical protein
VTISRVCYCSREEVKKALDVKQTARNDDQIDRAIEAAADSIDGTMKRVFYPYLDTFYIDWPNFQASYPWRIWLDGAELADVTGTVPVVTSGGNVIPNSSIFWGNPRYGAPYTYLELNRSKSASFGQGNTPQRDVGITAIRGYGIGTVYGGALAAAVTDTTGTAITVTDGSAVGVGNGLLIGAERMLVTGRANVSSGQTQQATGAGTASNADVGLTVTDGTKFFVGEVVQLDSERMLTVDVTGNLLTVKRAWDGTVLATHSGATVYVSRTLTVVRGFQGTTAATHLSAAAVGVHLVPPLIRQLSVAYSVISAAQEPGAYAKTQGSGPGASKGIGDGVAALEAKAYQQHGRKARRRTV